MKQIKIITTTFKQRMQELYKDRLDRVILYGSYARGEQQEDSDIDLMVVLKDEKVIAGKEIFRISSCTHDLNMKYSSVLSVVPTSRQKYANYNSGFYKNVRKEGVLIYFDMKQDVADSINKAQDFYEDALWCLKGERYEATVNRTYYAAFACAQAFLLQKDIITKTHKGTHNQFILHYTKPKILDPHLNNIFNALAAMRQNSDYDFSSTTEKEAAEQACEYAKIFLDATLKWFGEQAD